MENLCTMVMGVVVKKQKSEKAVQITLFQMWTSTKKRFNRFLSVLQKHWAWHPVTNWTACVIYKILYYHNQQSVDKSKRE